MVTTGLPGGAEGQLADVLRRGEVDHGRAGPQAGRVDVDRVTPDRTARSSPPRPAAVWSTSNVSVPLESAIVTGVPDAVPVTVTSPPDVLVP